MVYTMTSPNGYPKHDPKISNVNNLMSIKVVSCYVNFRREFHFHTINIWITQQTITKVSLTVTILKMV